MSLQNNLQRQTEILLEVSEQICKGLGKSYFLKQDPFQTLRYRKKESGQEKNISPFMSFDYNFSQNIPTNKCMVKP